MAKRTVRGQKKLFSLDFESLFISDHSQEDHVDAEISVAESSKNPKKLKMDVKKPLHSKTRKSNPDVDNAEVEELNDVTSFFENFGNDISKSIHMRRTRMEQFAEKLISVYQSKVAEMIQRQETEVEKFKEGAVTSIHDNLNKWEEEAKKLRLQENNLKKVLEQHLKMTQKIVAAHEQLIQDFNNGQKNFFQAYGQLRMRHKNEALELKKTVRDEVSKLQKKFLMECKREEMQSMKNYFSCVYF